MSGVKLADGAAPYLNKLAREQAKEKLLADIAVDATVCGLEGWDFNEYIEDLLSEIERIALAIRFGSEVPKWMHICAKCGNRISVFDTTCKSCGAIFDMSKPFERRLYDLGVDDGTVPE